MTYQPRTTEPVVNGAHLAPGPLPQRKGATSLKGTAGTRLPPGICTVPTNTEVRGPGIPAQGQGSGRMWGALPQEGTGFRSSSIFWSLLEADAKPASTSVESAPAVPPFSPRSSAPHLHPKGNLRLVSPFHRHLTPTKLLPQQVVTQKKAQRPNIKRQGSPPPALSPSSGSCQGTSVAIARAQASAKHFTACFLFSLFYFLCTNGKMHWAMGLTSGSLGPNRDVAQLPGCPQPLPWKDTLIPDAFLFISCLSWRQKYWVFVSLSDFKAERRGQICENRGVSPGEKGGRRAA